MQVIDLGQHLGGVGEGQGLVAADLDPVLARLGGQGHGHGQLDLVGQELVQGRISSRTVTGLASMAWKMPTKSSRCSGNKVS